MIGNIVFISGLIVLMIGISFLLDRSRGGHSKAYYIYLENNKVPPPSRYDYVDSNFIIKLL